MRKVNITTKDNPFDPFDQFDDWFAFDIEHNYYTSSTIARLTEISDEMTENEQEQAFEQAIDRLIEIDPLNIYVKVEKDT